jgi:cytochrome c peroxidase
MRYGRICGVLLFILLGCSDDAPVEPVDELEGKTVEEQFGGRIDIHNLPNYANQDVPDYILQDNAKFNPITNEGAILGRVLFYDKILSLDNSLSCSGLPSPKICLQ